MRGECQGPAPQRDVEIVCRRNARDVETESVEKRPDAGVRWRLGLFLVRLLVVGFRIAIVLFLPRTLFRCSKLDQRQLSFCDRCGCGRLKEQYEECRSHPDSTSKISTSRGTFLMRF